MSSCFVQVRDLILTATHGESCMDTFCRPLILDFEPYILLQGAATKHIIPAVSLNKNS